VRWLRAFACHQHRHALHLIVAGEERKAFLLRVPPDLWKELEKWAADDLRSINAQIEFLLRQAVARRKGSQEKSKS
jgi:hypothetical protein